MIGRTEFFLLFCLVFPCCEVLAGLDSGRRLLLGVSIFVCYRGRGCFWLRIAAGTASINTTSPAVEGFHYSRFYNVPLRRSLCKII